MIKVHRRHLFQGFFGTAAAAVSNPGAVATSTPANDTNHILWLHSSFQPLFGISNLLERHKDELIKFSKGDIDIDHLVTDTTSDSVNRVVRHPASRLFERISELVRECKTHNLEECSIPKSTDEWIKECEVSVYGDPATLLKNLENAKIFLASHLDCSPTLADIFAKIQKPYADLHFAGLRAFHAKTLRLLRQAKTLNEKENIIRIINIRTEGLREPLYEAGSQRYERAGRIVRYYKRLQKTFENKKTLTEQAAARRQQQSDDDYRERKRQEEIAAGQEHARKLEQGDPVSHRCKITQHQLTLEDKQRLKDMQGGRPQPANGNTSAYSCESAYVISSNREYPKITDIYKLLNDSPICNDLKMGVDYFLRQQTDSSVVLVTDHRDFGQRLQSLQGPKSKAGRLTSIRVPIRMRYKPQLIVGPPRYF